MTSRKIVQIAAATAQYDPEDEEGTAAPRLYALCADGSLWELSGSLWTELPPIPDETDATRG